MASIVGMKHIHFCTILTLQGEASGGGGAVGVVYNSILFLALIPRNNRKYRAVGVVYTSIQLRNFIQKLDKDSNSKTTTTTLNSHPLDGMI